MKTPHDRFVEELNAFLVSAIEFTSWRYTILGDRKFDRIYGEFDSEVFNKSRNLLFYLACGENDFEAFYGRFTAPGYTDSTKPVAWDAKCFIPDQICHIIMSSTKPIKTKLKEINKLYKKCVKLEKAFKSGRNK